MDVLDDIARFASERIRRSRHVESDQMSAGRADLDAVETQDTRPIGRRIGRPGRVAVVGEHNELEAGARGDGGDLVRRTAPSERVVWM